MSTATVDHGPLLVQLLGNRFGYTGQRATCQVRQDSFICQHLRSFADKAEIHIQLDQLPQRGCERQAKWPGLSRPSAPPCDESPPSGLFGGAGGLETR